MSIACCPELRDVATRFAVDSATTFCVDGAPAGVALARSAGSAGSLREIMADYLYRRYYSTGGQLTGGLDVTSSNRELAADLLRRLEEANPTVSYWSGGWTVTRALEDGAVRARRRLVERTFGAGAFVSHDRSSGRMRRGARIVAYHPRESMCAQDGFYFAYGASPWLESESPTCGRLYFNVTATSAPGALAVLCRALNEFSVPFQAKVDLFLGERLRADAMVLYLPWGRVEAALRILEIHWESLTQHTFDPVPVFTYRLVPGIAYADDPADGSSFGQSRTGVIAQALVRAWEEGARAVEGRLQVLVSEWQRAGLDPSAPYVRSRSLGRLSYVPPRASA